MSLINKIIKIFYSVKIRGNIKKTRILFLKFSKKIERTPNRGGSNNTNNKYAGIELFVPQIKNIGKNSYSSPDIKIHCPQTQIGSFCSIGNNVVLGHGNHPIDYLSTSPYFYFDDLGFKSNDTNSHNEFWKLEPIVIKNDVWIGESVFIKNGVTIGNGAVIGAKALVTKDVPDYAIVTGCPAKIMKYRFDEQTIKTLLELKWWELDDQIIRTLPYDNVEQTIKKLKEIRGAK